MEEITQQFREELQELIDRYKTRLSVPNIMYIAQDVLHKTLSIKYHPELHTEEMTELKAFKQDCIKLTEDNAVMTRQRKETAGQLVKAKEIIKDLLNVLPKENIEGIYEITEAAEQFLRDTDCNKPIRPGSEPNNIQWHDLRKDPNDLPDDCRSVWTNVGAGYHDDDGWCDDFGRLQNVIAWCEPKFEKVTNE